MSDTPPAARARGRFVAFGLITIFLLGALGVRLFVVQALHGDAHAARAFEVRTAQVPIPAARGLIFDRAGRPLAVNVPSWTAAARPQDVPPKQRSAVLALLGDLTGADPNELDLRLRAYGTAPADAIPLVSGLDRGTAALVAEAADRLPGVELVAGARREYLDEHGQPDGRLLAHVMGYTGRIDGDELAALATHEYRPDGVIGKDGVEASFESELRGADGLAIVERDASGRLGEVLETARAPRSGTNLMLTIDAVTQRHATEALRWGMDVAGVSQGVTIVMNPQNGEILAMVSLPTYDSNAFAGGIDAAELEAYLADANLPLRNHAIADIYPPGSTYKLVTSIAALEEGVTDARRLWPTYGCFQIPGATAGDCLHDWNREGFGPLDLVGAFAHSSDTFYYQLAIELGIDRMAAWAAELGFGQPTGIALPGEAAGVVPSSEWARTQGRSTVYTGEVAQAGIGQGPIAVTPLQVLNAYAAIANGGRLMRPSIVRGEADADGRLVREREPEVLRALDVDASTLETMRLAAREVVTSGHTYNLRDLALPGALSGKTGTAEFGDAGDDGVLPFHSWFVAYLPSAPGAADAELAVITFSHAAVVPGNVSAEVVKYFLQLHFGLEQDLRLDPNDFSLVAAN